MASDKKTGGISAWLVRLLTRFLFLLIVFVAGALTMHFGMHADDHDNIENLQTTVNVQNDEIDQLQDKLSKAQNQASLYDGTTRGLQDQIAALQQELSDVRDQLSFYEQLVPPGPVGAVNVRAFTVTQNGDVLEYRVLLTRNAKSDADPFVGQMQFTAFGDLDGEQHQVKLTANNTDNGSNQLDIKFQRFQRNAGVLQLEPGFNVASVQLEIFDGDKLMAKSEAKLGVQ